LRPGWKKFTETTLPGQGSPIIQHTARAADFLYLADAEHSGLRIRWFHPLANVFVGVGLLLTFCGLVAALFFASEGISSGPAGPETMKKMQEALVSLLRAATFKFWTSVAGLFCSIALGFVYRFGIARAQRAFETLCNEIERGMVILTAETIAQRQLEEVTQQGVQLREFNGQLAFTIGQGVEKALMAAMPQIMQSAMEPVALHLREATGNLGKMTESGFESMTKDFGKVLTDSAGQELRAVAQTITTTSEALNGMSGRIERATSGFEGAIKDMRESADLLAKRVEGNPACPQPRTIEGRGVVHRDRFAKSAERHGERRPVLRLQR
jgi:hypothetical protein